MIDEELQQLRQALRPAFLWDVARQRVAWANAAAVQMFGARGLTDLVERPFGEREPGVRVLRQVVGKLRRQDGGTNATNGGHGLPRALHVALEFPSTGREEPIMATVRSHPLPDGRAGLLVLVEEEGRATRDVPVLSEILQAMPQPVLALDAAGDPVYANPAAVELLSVAGDIGATARLFAGERALQDFLWRVRRAGVAVLTREVSTAHGRRTLRITGRATDDGLIILTLDDLTDRLRVERQGLPVAGSFPERTETPVDAVAPVEVVDDALPDDRPMMEEAGTADAAADVAITTALSGNDATAATGGLRAAELAALRRLVQALEEGTEADGGGTDRTRDDHVAAAVADEAAATASATAEDATASVEERQQDQEQDRAAEPEEAGEDGAPAASASAMRFAARQAEAPASGEDGDRQAGEPAANGRKRISIRVRKASASASVPGEARDARRAGDHRTSPVAANAGGEGAEISSGDAAADTGAQVAWQGRSGDAIPGDDASIAATDLPREREVEGSREDARGEEIDEATQQAKDVAAQRAVPRKETPDAGNPSSLAPGDDEREQARPSTIAADPALMPPVMRQEQTSVRREDMTAGDSTQRVAAEEGDGAGQAEQSPSRPQPPELVRDVLDHRPEPIILHRAESFYFANREARELFGFEPHDEAWDDIARTLTQAQDGSIVQLRDVRGAALSFRLKRDVFPWRAGVVVQSTLRACAVTTDDDHEATQQDEPSRHDAGAAAGAEAAADAADGSAATGGVNASPGAAMGAAVPLVSDDEVARAPRRAPASIIRIHAERPAGRSTGVEEGQGADAPQRDALSTATPGMPASPPVMARQGGMPMTTAPRPRQQQTAPAPAAETTAGAAEAGHHGSVAGAVVPDVAEEEGGDGGLDEPLRAMLETAADGIITLDAEGRILSFSNGARQLFGHAPGEVIGRPFAELLAAESRPVLADHLQRLRDGAAGRRSRGREVLGLTADGETIPLYMTLGRLCHAQPRDVEHRATFCAVVHDISPFKRRERALRRAKEEAEELSARKSEFLARISHELRTPLNAILGFSDVLRQELFGRLGNEKYRDYARDIYQSGEHLLALVNDLLDLARIEAGRYELDMKEVDLAAVVEESVNLMREQAAEAGIELRRVVPEQLPRVVADARSLKQILLNLLSNAVKFCRRGDRLVITLRQLADGGLELSVKDNGPGMSAEELEQALEPFRRVPRTGGDKPGTGLGLPLAKALTEANRARFNIDSTPGRGTEVRIVFPSHRVLA